MKVHHLNCATMCPRGAAFIGSPGGWFSAGRMVCHCLLVESRDGLVLVDTGIGVDDVAHPERSLGRAFVAVTGARLDERECAVRQVERLGFSASDVRHIVLTHLDLDHAGGLRDFPRARVHVHRDEHAAAMAPRTVGERERYKHAHWSHGPAWALHAPDGENWFGFEAVRPLGREVGDDVLLVPMHGHSRGHSCVAVKGEGGWLLHCGDAYFNRAEMHPTAPSCPPGLALFQRLVAVDGPARVRNQDRLRALFAAKGGDVRHFCAHDPVQFEQAARAAGTTA